VRRGPVFSPSAHVVAEMCQFGKSQQLRRLSSSRRLQAVQLGAKEHFLLDQICSTTVQAGHNSRLCLAQLYFLIFYDFAHEVIL
jgi:hypothetical protein